MNTNPDDWWLRRRHPTVSPGDAWSGGGRAFRARMSAKRARIGRSLGLVAAGCAAVTFLAPLAWAGRLHPCEAAEVALVDTTIARDGPFAASQLRVANWAGPDGMLLSHGRVGRQIASDEYARWPPFAGCTALFWRVRSEGASLDYVVLAVVRAFASRR
jgi:hypothetical protein